MGYDGRRAGLPRGGDHVQIFWDGDEAWYGGRVTRELENGVFTVLYDDGETSHENFLEMNWRVSPQNAPEVHERMAREALVLDREAVLARDKRGKAKGEPSGKDVDVRGKKERRRDKKAERKAQREARHRKKGDESGEGGTGGRARSGSGISKDSGVSKATGGGQRSKSDATKIRLVLLEHPAAGGAVRVEQAGQAASAGRVASENVGGSTAVVKARVGEKPVGDSEKKIELKAAEGVDEKLEQKQLVERATAKEPGEAGLEPTEKVVGALASLLHMELSQKAPDVNGRSDALLEKPTDMPDVRPPGSSTKLVSETSTKPSQVALGPPRVTSLTETPSATGEAASEGKKCVVTIRRGNAGEAGSNLEIAGSSTDGAACVKSSGLVTGRGATALPGSQRDGKLFVADRAKSRSPSRQERKVTFTVANPVVASPEELVKSPPRAVDHPSGSHGTVGSQGVQLKRLSQHTASQSPCALRRSPPDLPVGRKRSNIEDDRKPVLVRGKIASKTKDQSVEKEIVAKGNSLLQSKLPPSFGSKPSKPVLPKGVNGASQLHSKLSFALGAPSAFKSSLGGGPARSALPISSKTPGSVRSGSMSTGVQVPVTEPIKAAQMAAESRGLSSHSAISDGGHSPRDECKDVRTLTYQSAIADGGAPTKKRRISVVDGASNVTFREEGISPQTPTPVKSSPSPAGVGGQLMRSSKSSGSRSYSESIAAATAAAGVARGFPLPKLKSSSAPVPSPTIAAQVPLTMAPDLKSKSRSFMGEETDSRKPSLDEQKARVATAEQLLESSDEKAMTALRKSASKMSSRPGTLRNSVIGALEDFPALEQLLQSHRWDAEMENCIRRRVKDGLRSAVCRLADDVSGDVVRQVVKDMHRDDLK